MSMVYSHKIKLTIMSLLMILILLITWTAAPLSSSRAVLAEVTVAGEVVMTLAALASLMMIALGASGMDGALRNQAAATGTQPLTYVGQLLNRWLTNSASNMGFSLLAQKMQQGLSYLPNGTLYLDSEATAAVADFQRWAWDSDGANLVEFANLGSGNNLVGGGYTAYAFDCTDLSPLSGNYNWYTGSEPIYRYSNTTGPLVGASEYFALRDHPGRVYTIVSEPPSTGAACNCYVYLPQIPGAVRDFILYSTGWGINGSAVTASGGWDYLSTACHSDSSGYSIPVQSAGTLPSISDMVAESGSAVGDPDTFVGPMQQGQGTQLPLSDKVTVSADAAARLHLDNYLRAVAAAYAGTGTASVPVTDVGTGDEDTLPLSVPLDTPIGVTGVSDTAIDQSGSVAGSDAVATDFEGLDDYTMDLTQFFPFCVPFDLAYLFEKLRADPEALVIDWHFMIPYLDVDIPVEIDLSPFDSLAQLLRSLEVIAFIVALLIGTKNLIQGGD